MVQLLLSLLCLGPGLVGLWESASLSEFVMVGVAYVLLSGCAYCLVALLTRLLGFLVLAREVTLDTSYSICGIVCTN